MQRLKAITLRPQCPLWVMCPVRRGRNGRQASELGSKHEPLQRQTKRKSVEQDFPHFVDIAVPPGGLGKKLNAMYDFHAHHGIAPKRGQGRNDANGNVVRWCFADPALVFFFFFSAPGS